MSSERRTKSDFKNV